MYSLSIAVAGLATPWRLVFKTEPSARAAEKLLGVCPGLVTLHDDFGQSITLRDYTGYLLEDLETSRVAAIWLLLYNHQIQMDAQKKAAQSQNGPAVLTPGMVGVPFRQ